MDTLTVSERMSLVRSKDTKPEFFFTVPALGMRSRCRWHAQRMPRNANLVSSEIYDGQIVTDGGRQ
jgi:hypothetical protein